MKRLVGLMLLVSLAAVACTSNQGSGGDPPTPPAARDANTPIVVAAGKPIVIGSSAPLTGPDKDAGIEDRDAMIVGINSWKATHGSEVQGHRIEVRAEDDGCTDAKITVQAAERLLGEPGLVGVIGPDCSAGAKAAIPIYKNAGIVAISGSATETALTAATGSDHYFFRTVYRNDLQGELIGQFIGTTLKAKTAYIIDDSESYGRDLADSATRVMEPLGVRVTRESVQRGEVNFVDLARRIAAANSDFVGFGGFNPEAALLYRQLRDSGYKGPFGAGDAAASIPNFVDPLGATAAEGVYFAGCPLTLPPKFLGEWTKSHGGPPVASSFVAQYADAARILLDAVANVGSRRPDGSLVIDPKDLRDAIQATSVSDGVSGRIAFDANGDRASVSSDASARAVDLGWTACQVQNGELKQLFP